MVNGKKTKTEDKKARIQCLRSERSNKQIPDFIKGRFSPAMEIKDGANGLKSKTGKDCLVDKLNKIRYVVKSSARRIVTFRVSNRESKDFRRKK